MTRRARRIPSSHINAATSSATKTNAKATVPSEGLKWETSLRSDENIAAVEDECAEMKVELPGRPDIEFEVEWPITGSKACGQAIIFYSYDNEMHNEAP